MLTHFLYKYRPFFVCQYSKHYKEKNKILILKLKKKIKMPTSMPFYNELAAAAGSTYVNAVMIEKFQREVTVLRVDEQEMTKKVHEIRSRVSERDLLMVELEKLYPFESTLLSIVELNRLQIEDMKEGAELLVAVMKKITRINQLLSFIDKLKSLPYQVTYQLSYFMCLKSQYLFCEPWFV